MWFFGKKKNEINVVFREKPQTYGGFVGLTSIITYLKYFFPQFQKIKIKISIEPLLS